MPLSDDPQVEVLYAAMVTKVLAADAADAALQNAINNLPALRQDAVTKGDEARDAAEAWLRRCFGNNILTGPQRQACLRVLGDDGKETILELAKKLLEQ